MNNCPVCGSKVAQGENFCKACGTKITSPQKVINQNVNQEFNKQMNDLGIPTENLPQENNVNVTDNVINDEGLIKAYVGNNYDKLKSGSWSWCAFLFGSLYYFYRKMWLLGLLWYAIAIVGNLFLQSLMRLINLVLIIVGSIKFMEWYLKHVNEQVAKIKMENPGKTQEELASICRKKGGTTAIPIVIFVLLYLAIILFTGIPAIMSIIDDAKSNSEYNEQYDKPSIPNDKSGLIGDLTVTVPGIFEESKYSSDTLKMYHSDSSFAYSCSFDLDLTRKGSLYTDAKSYLEKDIIISVSDEFSGIEEKEINGQTWLYASVKSEYRTKYYYSTEKDEKIYTVTFSNSYTDDGTCSKAHETLINSMRFK